MYFESHQSLLRHPKTERAADLLGLPRAHLVGHLSCLWWWCLDYAKDGDLSRYSDAQIARAAEYPGDAVLFVSALVEAGFIDAACEEPGPALAVHDWADYGGKVIKQRRGNAQRQAAFRDRHRDEPPPAPPQQPDVPSNGYVTVTADSPAPRNAHGNDHVTVTLPLRNSLEKTRQDHDRGTDHDRDQGSQSVHDRDLPAREQAGPRVRTIHERERAARERERAGEVVFTDWHDQTWLLFKEQYGKVPPKDLRARWPCYCDTPDVWQQIQEGLGYWRKCRQWVADGPDYVTRAETWLAEQKYLVHPPPYDPEKEQHHGGPAQPGGRAGRRDHPRTSGYVWAGDPDDPYWRENHGLISTGLLGPDPDGREGVLGDDANAEHEARRGRADGGLPDLPGRGRAQA
jgi:hypothetical protein